MMSLRQKWACYVLAVFISISCRVANADLIEDFDGGGSGIPFSLTNSSGGAPSIVAAGGSTGSFVRLANLNGSNNNSIAWDEDPSTTGPSPFGLTLAFHFRMTDDDANAAAGGCCGSAADGLGIGLYSTATYGTTGPVNPATSGAVWERPAHPDAFAVGLDIFQNIDVVNLNWGGSEVANASVQHIMDLNDGVWHRMIVALKPNGADALVDVRIIEDVQGMTSIHNVFSNQAIVGLDLANLPNYRLIGGGRTGGAFHNGDFDNIALFPTPVPPTALLTLSGLLILAPYAWRRHKRQ